MEAVTEKVISLAQGGNEATRKSILNALRALANSIETPDNSVTRIWGSHLNLAVVRVGINLKIFSHLADSPTPMSLERLAGMTGADSILLARILRYLASVGHVVETGCDEFSSNNVTTALAQPGYQATIKHYFDGCGRPFHELPAFLEKNGYKNPSDSHQTVWQDAWKTQEDCYEWMETHPTDSENLNMYMATRRQNQTSWIQKYPVIADATNLSGERTLFVDIAGNIGHQAAEFRNTFPQLPGKVVVQDLPSVVERAIKSSGVEAQVYDFTKPQPIKGAKFYYLRAILHNWPDEKCLIILKNITSAMGEDSILLIDDMVIPDRGVHWAVTQLDITVLVASASMQRTETQWQRLYDNAGLHLVRRYVYTPGMHETVTALILK